MGLIKAESYKKGIISSTIYNICAKGIGFVNSLLIIYIFGSGLATDLYFLILATVTLITSFINGIDLLVLIPESMRLRQQKGDQAEKRFLNFFIILYLSIGALVALFILLLPVLFYSFFSKYKPDELEVQNLLLMLSSVLFPIQLLNSLLISILTSHKYFTVPMVVSLVNSLISIIILLLLQDTLSVKGAVIGIIAGYTANLLWLVLFMKKKFRWNFFEKPLLPSKKVLRDIFLLQLNILPVSLRTYITTLLLSGLGVGVITSLNYGQQISFIPEMLIVTQVVAVAGVKFNELSSKDDTDGLNFLVIKMLKLLHMILLPVAAIMALISSELSNEIFKYGKKILPETIENIALIIFFMALTLPGRSLDMTMTRLLTAQQRIKETVLYAIATHIIITALVFIGIKAFGLKGFLLAFFVGHNIFLPALYYILLKKIAPFVQYLKWILATLPFMLFNVGLILLFFLFKKYMLNGISPFIIIFSVPVLYVAAILLFNRIYVYYTPLNTFIDKLISRK